MNAAIHWNTKMPVVWRYGLKAFVGFSWLTVYITPALSRPATIPVNSFPAGNISDTTSSVPPKLEWHLETNEEAVYIAHGTVRNGFTYDHLLHLEGSLNTKPLGLWDGGHLLVSAVQILSGRPTNKYIGDLQVASNIDAKSAIRFYEFSYTQTFKNKLVIAGGLIDMNKFFIKADHASVLMNSSFGISPDMSANVPVSIFPKPGFGISAAKYFSNWKIQGSVFQNDPDDRSDLSLSHRMTTVEADYRNADNPRHAPFILKWGIWHHTANVDNKAYWGMYTIIQKSIRMDETRTAGIFLQAGSSPYKTVDVPFYLGFGVLFKPVLHNRINDEFSFGFAKAWTHLDFSVAETAWEITYLYQLKRFLSLQPDIQVIQNPGGSKHKSAVALFLRLQLKIH